MGIYSKIKSKFSHWKYNKHKNLITLVLSVVLSIIVLRQPFYHQIIARLDDFGYIGAFVAGLLFISTFTITSGALILINVAKTLPLWQLIIFAGLGAALGDIFVFFFVKKEVICEIQPIYDKIIGSHFKKLIHTKYFSWTLPVIGALIIASPLPDELGISLIGLSETKLLNFVLISAFSHTLGIFLVVTAAKLL